MLHLWHWMFFFKNEWNLKEFQWKIIFQFQFMISIQETLRFGGKIYKNQVSTSLKFVLLLYCLFTCCFELWSETKNPFLEKIRKIRHLDFFLMKIYEKLCQKTFSSFSKQIIEKHEFVTTSILKMNLIPKCYDKS